MFAAYCASSTAWACSYRAVAADTGAIGGDRSHEFQVIADTGEDAIVYCPDQRLRRQHRAGRGAAADRRRAPRRRRPLAKTPTPGKSTCEDVAALLGLPLAAHGEVAGAGHRRAERRRRHRRAPPSGCCWCAATTSLNEVKAGKVPGLKGGFRFATVAEIEDHFGCKPGYLGPIGTAQAGQGGGRPHRGAR